MGAGDVLSVWDKINSWMAPLEGAVDALLRPLVQPLADQFDSITGDSDAVRGTADKWRAMAGSLRALGDFEASTASRVSSDWSGQAHDAFRGAISQLVAEIDDLARQIDDTAEFLDDAAMEVEVAEQLVEDVIRELIEWALVTLAVSAALSIVTVGLSDVAGAGLAAAEAATAGSRIATILYRVSTALQRCSDALRALKAAKGIQPFIIRSLIKGVVLKPVVKATTGLTADPFGAVTGDVVHGLEQIAADEYDDQVDGQTAVQTPVRSHLDDVLAPLADHTRGAAHAVDGLTKDVDDRVPDFPGS